MNARTHRHLTYGLLLLFLLGCAPAISVTPISTPILLPTHSLSATPVSHPTQTTSVLETATPSLQFFYPETVQLCPKNKEVTIQQLGINKDWKVILFDSEESGLWFLSEGENSPQLIERLPPSHWTSTSISPDGKRLAYTTWNSDHSSSTRIYDLENRSQNEALNLKDQDGLAPYVVWLSNQELLVVNACHTMGCHYPLEIIDTNSGQLTAVDETQSEPYDTYLGFFESAGHYYALYSSTKIDSYSEFYVYDYSTKQKVQVFPWLKAKVFFYPTIGTNLGIFTSEKKTVLFFEQSYGFDIGMVDTGMEQWMQTTLYNSVMKRVVTDINFDQLRFSFHAINPSNGNLLLSMNYKDYVNSTDGPQNVENAFFVLDLMHPVIDQRINSLIFTDYCFTTTGYQFKGFSPDGRIVVFASDEENVFLNLQTGYMARLADWKFIGWAK